MCIATITAEGQITIPSEIRRQLGMSRGGQVHLECQEGTLRLTPVIDDIRAAFGLLKANKSVSLEEMESAIEQAVVEHYGQS